MNALHTLGPRLWAALCALALPGLAMAQAQDPAQRAPPGGVSSAWPLGVIVALVALMMVWGAIVDRRRRHGAPRSGASRGR